LRTKVTEAALAVKTMQDEFEDVKMKAEEGGDGGGGGKISGA